MHLSVYLPDVQMLRFVAIAGLEDAIPVPDINWEAPENQRDGMPDVHLMNNGWEEPKILDLLEQANINPDFSVMVKVGGGPKNLDSMLSSEPSLKERSWR